MDNKPHLIETIRIQNGRLRYIQYHNQRFNNSRRVVFNVEKDEDLSKIIDRKLIPSFPNVKCRITYNEKIIRVEFEEYILRPIQSLQHIEIGSYTYDHKLKDRKKLQTFFNQRNQYDDILMTKNGWITDTYYANIALRKDEKWFTPKNPLLKGTQRARLIDQNKIVQKDIHISTLKDYDSISIFNAMIPFKQIEFPISETSISLNVNI